MSDNFVFAESSVSEPHKKLYDREISARYLGFALAQMTGAREIAYLDECYGAGKTVFVSQFRQLLLLERSKLPKGFDSIYSAIYIHIPCHELDIPISTKSLNEEEYDTHVLNLLSQALEKSAKCELDLDCSSIQDFVLSLLICAGRECKFIIHFDEIGIYEKHGEVIATNMFDRICKLGNALKATHNFFVISGRSRLIHTVIQDQNVNRYSSPIVPSKIPLPPLSDTSVESILADAELLTRVKDEGNLEFICRLCSGVPSAVNAVVIYLSKNVSTDRSELIEAVRMEYGGRDTFKG